MDKVFIEALQLETLIGVYDWEREAPQLISVDLELETDLRAAAAANHVEATVDYDVVTARVVALTRAARFELIESLAEAIATRLLEEFPIQAVKVRLCKPGAVRGARNVGVEIVRRQVQG
ncbi:MAG: dihydroneopterin aldolase [Gammaproteobacteria bacterium]|nr:dihydroneopterin aldolase [Gammaproteobacteria bacterium]